MKVNQAIRCIRKSKGFTQVHVAKNLGMSVQTYNGYELGRRQVKADFVKEISFVLEVPVEYLFNYKLYESKNKSD
ncbi:MULTISPECIES: helix-turn-helix transcriptional regulator [Halobacillus]|uniref:helix-turn-helix transcriptional regulator n=1 Tax=Halobacillus TaxID=45667 RepID=UPI0009A81249|nr:MULTISPECIES: helix-turn-helix transcriptional regulator [Halobacillus]